MTIEEFIGGLQRRRVRVVLEGAQIRVTAPAGVLSAEVRQEITARKQDIIEYLRAAAAARTSTQQRGRSSGALTAFRETGVKPPIFIAPQIEGRAGVLWASFAQALGPDQPVYGLQCVDEEGRPAPLQSVEGAAQRFVGEIRRVRPKGPYNVLACCAGGPIGYEIAQLLHASGERTRLAMLDTWPPRVMEALQGSSRAMANGRALASYAPRPYAGPLLLLLTSGRVFPGRDPRLYWAGLAADCSVVWLPGNDVDDLFRDVTRLAAPLRPYFDEDAAECTTASVCAQGDSE
jgi:hypothetical protein